MYAIQVIRKHKADTDKVGILLHGFLLSRYTVKT